jgi:GntR family transcriptional regulator/MocR family aminotransferase
MRRWELTVALDPVCEQPLFLQLASGIADDIQRGRLKPGEPLPGSRELAERLGVNRKTVVESYHELATQGLVRTRTGGGTFIAEASPDFPPKPLELAPPEAGPSASPTYELRPWLDGPEPASAPRRGAFLLSRGMPDVRLVPRRALSRAFARAVQNGRSNVLTHADPQGHPQLRAELATMLSRTRGFPATAADVLVTHGIEHGIDLVARALIAPGDVVAVEAIGYPAGWNALRRAGAQLVPLRVDHEGLDVEALAAYAQGHPLRAVLLTPHHQFPTTVVMSPRRRARLAELALRHRFAVIEDDDDYEFHYEGRPLFPIAAGKGRSNALYVSSLFNVLAPGLSVGFVVAPPAVLNRLVSLRAGSDGQSAAAVERSIAELFEEGEILRHARRMRCVYAARRDALVKALRQHLPGALEVRVPDGGMALWTRVDPSIDIPEWVREADREGVVLQDARAYDFHRLAQPFLRLGFTFHDEKELEEAVRRMARALTRTRHSRSSLAL